MNFAKADASSEVHFSLAKEETLVSLPLKTGFLCNKGIYHRIVAECDYPMSEYGERYPGKFTRPPTADQSERQADQGWIDRSHQELVMAFRGYIAKEKQNVSFPISSSRLIQEELNRQANFAVKHTMGEREGQQFYTPLYHAWNVISYQLKEPSEMHVSAHTLSRFCNAAVARNKTRPKVTRLSHPLQIKILDALADAVGIPYARGQRDIEIPEKLRS